MKLDQYFDKRIKSLAESLKPVQFDTWNRNKLVLTVEFFTIQIGKNYDVFIPTGTKANPRGLSTVHDVFVLFIKDGKVYLSLHERDLKDFIINNLDLVKRGIGEQDDPIEGYWINLSKLLPLRVL